MTDTSTPDRDAEKLAELVDQAAHNITPFLQVRTHREVERDVRLIARAYKVERATRAQAEAEAGVLLEAAEKLRVAIRDPGRDGSIFNELEALEHARKNAAPKATAWLAELAGLRERQRTPGTYEVCEGWRRNVHCTAHSPAEAEKGCSMDVCPLRTKDIHNA